MVIVVLLCKCIYSRVHTNVVKESDTKTDLESWCYFRACKFQNFPMNTYPHARILQWAATQLSAVQIVILELTIFIIYYIKFCVKPYIGQSMRHLYIIIQFGFKCMTHKLIP